MKNSLDIPVLVPSEQIVHEFMLVGPGKRAKILLESVTHRTLQRVLSQNHRIWFAIKAYVVHLGSNVSSVEAADENPFRILFDQAKVPLIAFR